MKLTPYLKSFVFMLGLSALWALPSPETIVASTVQPDDPLQINTQISASMLLSFHNLYPDLTAMRIIPIGSNSTTRLTNPGSSILPSLSSTNFTTEGIAPLQHTDEVATAPLTV